MKHFSFSLLLIIVMCGCGIDDATLKITDSHLMKKEFGDKRFVVVKASIYNYDAAPFDVSMTSFKLETVEGSYIFPDNEETKRFGESCSKAQSLYPRNSTQCVIAFPTKEHKPTLSRLLLESKDDKTAAITKLSAFFPIYPTEASFKEIENITFVAPYPPREYIEVVKSKDIMLPVIQNLLTTIQGSTKLVGMSATAKQETVKVLREINFTIFDNLTSMFINLAKAGLKIAELKSKELDSANCDIIIQSFFAKSSELGTNHDDRFEKSLIEGFEKETMVLNAFNWSVIADIFQGVLVAEKISLVHCADAVGREELRKALVAYKK